MGSFVFLFTALRHASADNALLYLVCFADHCLYFFTTLGKPPLADHKHKHVSGLKQCVPFWRYGRFAPFHRYDNAVLAPIQLRDGFSVRRAAGGDHIGLDHLLALLFFRFGIFAVCDPVYKRGVKRCAAHGVCNGVGDQADGGKRQKGVDISRDFKNKNDSGYGRAHDGCEKPCHAQHGKILPQGSVHTAERDCRLRKRGAAVGAKDTHGVKRAARRAGTETECAEKEFCREQTQHDPQIRALLYQDLRHAVPAAEYLRQNQPNHAAHREHACKFDPLRYFSDLCKQIPACNHKGVVKRAEKAADNSKQNQKPVPSKRNRFGLVTEHCILPEKQLGNEIGNYAGNDRHTQHGFVKRFVDLFQNEHNAGERRVECRCKPGACAGTQHAQFRCFIRFGDPRRAFCRHGAELHAWAFSAEAETGEYGNGAAEQFAKNHFPPIRRDSAPYFRRYLRYTAACRIGHFFYNQGNKDSYCRKRADPQRGY